jgi:hypothetical protein
MQKCTTTDDSDENSAGEECVCAGVHWGREGVVAARGHGRERRRRTTGGSRECVVYWYSIQ